MAARLCFAWGIADVEAWLDQQPKHVIEFWEAFDAVEPIGEAWMQTARLGVAINPTLRMQDYLPPRYSAKYAVNPVQDCDAMRDRLERSV